MKRELYVYVLLVSVRVPWQVTAPSLSVAVQIKKAMSAHYDAANFE